MREPDFQNLLKVLRREPPNRPTQFEIFMNGRLYNRLAGENTLPDNAQLAPPGMTVRAFRNAGYDFATLLLPGFSFPQGERHTSRTFSINEGGLIRDWASFERYPWPDPENCEFDVLDDLEPELPDGMKLIVFGPCGVLENAIFLVGYEPLCLLTRQDPELVERIFAEIGSRLVRFYEICSGHPAIGAMIGNDDWGFRTQTMFAPEDMRRYVFPWHKRIVEAIHAQGKPAILHSCGNLKAVMTDIIVDMGYDGKHSYEDQILPVEEAYEAYHDRIAILGGIDVNFLCHAPVEEIRRRARAMLERAAERGGYALGSGNSIPEYVPDEAYFAMISAAVDVGA